MKSTYERGLKQSLDWTLVICYLLLVFIGWLNIYASVHSTETGTLFDFDYRSGKQFVWILTSIVLAILILFVFNPRLWEVISWPTYLITLVLLVAVIFLGVEVKGSRSWFDLGPVRFQPAEVSKIATALMLATVMSQGSYRISKAKDFIITAIILGLPMLIILAEKETGSALVYMGFVFMLYREGLTGWILGLVGLVILLFILTLTASPFVAVLVLIAVVSFCYSLEYGHARRWVFTDGLFILAMAFLPKIWTAAGWSLTEKVTPTIALVGICLLALPFQLVHAFNKKKNFLYAAIAAFIMGIGLIASTNFIFNNVLQDHQRKRIEVLLGMKEDPAGVGYNVNQSMIAIGSGGLAGKGYLQGTQTTYGFVPEQSTDFIFCTVGEEWGFIGCTIVILLYVIMIFKIIQDAEQSREAFTRIYGYCVASLIFMHLFINIGMTIGLMPVIGIPLPLLSYGGSSLWAFTVLIFIFIALDRQEKKYY